MGAAASVGGGDVFARLVRRYGAPREDFSSAVMDSLRAFYDEQLAKHGDDEAAAFRELSAQYEVVLESHGGPRPADDTGLCVGLPAMPRASAVACSDLLRAL
jgi:hypothetical protein